MDAQTFQQLSAGMSADPCSRIPGHIAPLLQNDSSMIDCHCHVFDNKTVPKAIMNTRMHYTQKVALKIARILHLLRPRSNDDWASRNAYFIELFTKTTKEITDKLLSYYPPDTILTPLMMDMHNRADSNQRENAGYYIQAQAKDLADLIGQGYYLLPFFPADPTFKDELSGESMFDIVYKAFTGGYGFMPFGLKVYPNLGYMPANPSLLELYRFAEAKRIPVTTHCSRGFVHAYCRRIRNIEGYKIGPDGQPTTKPESKTFLSGKSFARYFNHPKNWEPVLRDYPNLKINFGHFGGAEQWYRYLKGKNNTYPSRLIDYMYRYPNVYADISFTNVYPELYSLIRDKLERNDLIRSRALYGYDYYMVVVRGHYRSLKVDFETAMGSDIIKEISINNPRRFLLG